MAAETNVCCKYLKAEEVADAIDLQPNRSYLDMDVLIAAAKVFRASFETEKVQQQQLLFDSSTPVRTEEEAYSGDGSQLYLADPHAVVNACKKDLSLIPKKPRGLGRGCGIVIREPKEEAVLDISKLEKRNMMASNVPREEVLRRERALKRPMIVEEDIVKHKKIKFAGCSRILRFEDPDWAVEEEWQQFQRPNIPSRMTTELTLTITTNTAKKENLKKKKKKKTSSGGGEVLNNNNVNEIPNPTRELPNEFMRRITEMGGTNIILVITKKLTVTDCRSAEGRLSMPLTQTADFLEEREKDHLQGRDESGNINKKGGKKGTMVWLIQPNLEEIEIKLKRWDMPKSSGSQSSMYVLVKPWNDVVERNGLRSGDAIQVWSFRVRDELRLALVRFPSGE